MNAKEAREIIKTTKPYYVRDPYWKAKGYLEGFRNGEAKGHEKAQVLVDKLRLLHNHQTAKCICDWREFKGLCKEAYDSIGEALAQYSLNDTHTGEKKS